MEIVFEPHYMAVNKSGDLIYYKKYMRDLVEILKHVSPPEEWIILFVDNNPTSAVGVNYHVVTANNYSKLPEVKRVWL